MFTYMHLSLSPSLEMKILKRHDFYALQVPNRGFFYYSTVKTTNQPNEKQKDKAKQNKNKSNNNKKEYV